MVGSTRNGRFDQKWSIGPTKGYCTYSNLHQFQANCYHFQLTSPIPGHSQLFLATCTSFGPTGSVSCELHLLRTHCEHFKQTETLSITHTSRQLRRLYPTVSNQLLGTNCNYLQQTTTIWSNLHNCKPTVPVSCLVQFVNYAFTPSNTNWLHFMLSAPTATYLHVCQTKCTYCKPLAMFQPARPT